MVKHVIFSNRAFTTLLNETRQYKGIETGGLFLGHRCGDIWFVLENIDPGPEATHQTAYFTFDQNYTEHAANNIFDLYKKPLDVIGLWHRHPGSIDHFSGTDDQTNERYANSHESGSISALVNIDPEFRLTMYAVPEPRKYHPIKYSVGNHLIPDGLLQLVDYTEIINEIETQENFREVLNFDQEEYEENTIPSIGNSLLNVIFNSIGFNLDYIIYSFLNGNHSVQKNIEDKNFNSQTKIIYKQGISFQTALNFSLSHLQRVSNKNLFNDSNIHLSDEDIDKFLSKTKDDFLFLDSIGIKYDVDFRDDDIFEYEFYSNDIEKKIKILFLIKSEYIVFQYDQNNYLYQEKLFTQCYTNLINERAKK